MKHVTRTRSTVRRRIQVAVAAGLTTTVIAACTAGADEPASTAVGETWDEVTEAAAQEGQSVIYTTDTDAWGQAVGAAAYERTGVSMPVGIRGSGGTIQARLEAEVSAGAIRADIFSTTDKNFFVENADLFVDLSAANIPNFEDYPDQAKFRDVCVDIKQSVSGILYNTDLVPADEVPTSWEDLTDPYWTDKAIIYDPSSTNTALGWAIQMRENFGDEFLESIADQSPSLSPSSIPAAEQVSAGAYEITYLSNADSSAELRSQGAPLEFVVGTDPTIGTSGCAGILKDAEHPNAARVMLDFLMAPESQSAACDAGVPIASPIDAPGCLEVPEGWEPTPLDPDTGQIVGTADNELRATVLSLLGIG